MAKVISVDFNNMMADRIGENGISQKDIDEYMPLLSKTAKELEENKEKDTWRLLPENAAPIIENIKECANWVRSNFDYYVVLGIGASALAPIFIQRALGHLHYNELPKEKRNGPKIYIEDNIDPERMSSLLDVIDLEKTCFNVISKTGTTTETSSQMLVVTGALKKAGLSIKDHLIVTSDEHVGSMLKISQTEGTRFFSIPSEIQGRFVNFTPICFLPLAAAGFDIDSFVKGAKDFEDECTSDVFKNVAYADAAMQFLAYKKGAQSTIIMPYAESLKFFADVYTIMWGESLSSKDIKGQIPIKALGVTDFHSQLQLYLQSPLDKVLTMVCLKKYPVNVEIPKDTLEYIADMDYLRGGTMEKLIKAESFSNGYALAKEGCKNKTILLEEMNAYTAGALLEMLQLETLYLGKLMGVDVYNCPAYDNTKGMTSAIFNRRGYDEYIEKYKNLEAPNKNYIV